MVLHQRDPGVDPRCSLDRDGHGRWIKLGELRQLAIDSKITGARPLSQKEGVVTQMRLERIEKPLTVSKLR